jgi:HlyD family secretion protein
MSATVDIKTETAKDVLSVPIQAVTVRSDEDEKTTDRPKKLQEIVYLYKDGLALQQEVETGIQDESYIEIREGLEAGQSVIAAPYSAISKKLEDSARVKQVESKKALWKD